MKFDLPDPGEGIAEADLVEWQVSEGDSVEADDPVASVETDKAVVDIPIPEAGTIDDLLVDEGDTAIVGEPFLEYTPGDADEGASDDKGTEEHGNQQTQDHTENEDQPDETAEADDSFVKPPEQPDKPVKAMPRVRHKARQENIDLNNVDGTGPNSRITLDDVQAVIHGHDGDEDVTIDSDTTPSTDQTTEKKSTDEQSTDAGTDEEDEEETNTQSTDRSETVDEDQNETSEGTDKQEETKDTTSTAEPETLSDDDVAVERFSPEGIKDETPGDNQESQDVSTRESEADEDEGEEQSAGVDGDTAKQAGENTDDAADNHQEAPDGDEAEPTPAQDESKTEEPATNDESMNEDGDEQVQDTTRRDDTAEEADKVNGLQGTRRVIAENMRHSLESTAQTTITEEVDVTQLVNLHDVITEDNDAPITYLSYFVKAATKTLKAHPGFNATFDEDGVTEHDEVNLGIAVDTERGLLVPVIQRADHKGLEGLAYSIADLADRTRADDNEPGDFDDATFTVSSLGNIGGEVFTPILNPPQVAILGVGRIKERPRYHDDELVKANIVHLSLTIDHQVIDGADAARFLKDIKGRLESPKDLLLINV